MRRAWNFKDLTGQIFERLTVIRLVDKNKHGQLLWECLCKCGNKCIVTGLNLHLKQTRSCGCLLSDVIHDLCFKDISGQVFERLTVIKFLCIKNRSSFFLCKCICGNETVASSANLKSGHTKSCGCLRKELSSTRFIAKLTTHGLRQTRFHKVWEGMMARCYNSKHKSYPNYGGRNIIVCDRWHSFVNFIADKYQSYLDFATIHGEKNTTGDRPNPNGNYEPSNHKWATPKDQGLTRRNSSKTKNLKEYKYWKNKLRNLVLKAIKMNIKDIKLFKYYVGCTPEEFKTYIESLWGIGMSWDNHGKSSNKWQLDHVKECYKFDLSKEQDRLVCFNYKNYQPMWYDNHLEKTLAANRG